METSDYWYDKVDEKVGLIDDLRDEVDWLLDRQLESLVGRRVKVQQRREWHPKFRDLPEEEGVVTGSGKSTYGRRELVIKTDSGLERREYFLNVEVKPQT